MRTSVYKIAAIAFITAFVLSFQNSASAQRTSIYTNEDAGFKLGLDLFEKQKYGAAQKNFLKFIASQGDQQSLVRIDAQYYAALCAIELFNKDGEILLKKFIDEHPESPKVKIAYFHLGKYNFRKKKFVDALQWLEKVDIYDLTKEESYEYLFKRGYCYFELGVFEKAKNDFYEIKDIDNKYAASANYYFSHIAYNDKNYETALQGFLRLSGNEYFGSIIPYYVSQLYYLQGKYDDVISYSLPLLDSANIKRAPEIARIIGESYYKTLRYKEAIPYLKKYEAAFGSFPRKDLYELGYAYYMCEDWTNAIKYFQNAVEKEDSLTQNAYYHLGDCYLKKGDKQFARSAFGYASKSNFYKEIKEDAMFSYAKLCYELSYNPFSEAVDAFQHYIKEYPNSVRIDEAYQYLVNVYLSTKNFKEALESLEKIQVLSNQLQEVYQKISYFRGIELFNNLQLDTAIKFFDKSLIYKYDKKINALAHYWKGEVYYRKKMYPVAIENFKVFMFEPGAFNLAEYNNSNYNIAYSYFQLKDYPSAIIGFRKFLSLKSEENPKKVNDAYIRLGDAYFISKDYSNAVEYYSEAIEIKLLDIDYAMYQKSLGLGILQKTDAKISELLSLLNSYPRSNYAAASKFELGKTYLTINDNEKSLIYFKKVLEDHPNNSYVSKSLLQMGLIYYNTKQDDLALENFKKLIRQYPSSSEAKESLGQIRKIYVAKGDIQPFEKYIEEVPFANVSKALLDSSTYEIAKNSFFDNNCEKAIKDFQNYFEKYPEGIFALEANYYKSDCQYKTGHALDALEGYNYVIGKPKNNFSEQSLMNASLIHFNAKNYSEALQDFNKLESMAEYPKNILEARIGQMRSNFFLKNYPAAIQYANTVISTDKTSNEIIDEAHITIAKSALESENYDLALVEFKTTSVISKSILNAEALYNMAYIQYLKADYAESKKTILELVNQEPAYPLWLTKALILLADNYVALNDNFQARHTLKSVIEDSSIPELINQAKMKLDAINEAEKKKIVVLPSDEIKIEFNESDISKKLFGEEVIR